MVERVQDEIFAIVYVYLRISGSVAFLLYLTYIGRIFTLARCCGAVLLDRAWHNRGSSTAKHRTTRCFSIATYIVLVLRYSRCVCATTVRGFEAKIKAVDIVLCRVEVIFPSRIL